jgi:hypothetical protein
MAAIKVDPGLCAPMERQKQGDALAAGTSLRVDLDLLAVVDTMPQTGLTLYGTSLSLDGIATAS